MNFIADFHTHSYLSRATSKESTLEHYAKWARLKGINLIGTGDFTHPKWFGEIKEKLVEDTPGIYKFKEEPQLEILNGVKLDSSDVRFILTVEISSIYKKGDKVRKVHNLIFAPNIETVSKINQSLARIGNIESDGRPIIGLDSRNLLELVLQASEDAFIIPAHIWTPWFSVLGSKSGFDSIEECFDDLSPYIFALETGLSSDPDMNWRLSQLDKFTLISNSDAHSPSKLGREANLFDTEMNYYKIRDAIKTGKGFIKTVEFYPEEGKYHFDGHRKCNVRLSPEESAQLNNLCPVCGKPLTIGVMNRVAELADRKEPEKPEKAPDFINLIPLAEIIGQIYSWGPSSKKIWPQYTNIISKFNSEFDFLLNTPLDDIKNSFDSLLSEGIRRVRTGEVKLLAGYDGEFGEICIFDQEEKKSFLGNTYLFNVKTENNEEKPPAIPEPVVKGPEMKKEIKEGIPFNEAQQEAIEYSGHSLIIKAGPGTGKTRTLTEKIVYTLHNYEVRPENILAVTFTNKAARELKERIGNALKNQEHLNKITIGTFHHLGLLILKENTEIMPVIISEEERWNFLSEELTLIQKREILKNISKYKQAIVSPYEVEDENDRKHYEIYQQNLEKISAFDYDDLILKPVKILELDDYKQNYYQQKFSHIFIDEYQDINYSQYRLINLIYSPSNHICVIGDPNQAIYGFRGADYKYFMQFGKDYPDSREITLNQNYRSGQTILDASGNVIKHNDMPVQLNAVKKIKGEILYSKLPTEKSEAEYVIKNIEKLIGGISLFSVDSGRGGYDDENVSFKDIAVLYRTHSQQKYMKEAFERSGIPFQIIGDKSYFNKKGVKEVISYLKAAVFDEGIPVKDLLTTPDRKYHSEDIDKINRLLYEGKKIKELKEIFRLHVNTEKSLTDIANKLNEIKKILIELYSRNDETKGLEILIRDLFTYCGYDVLTADQQRFISFCSSFNNDIKSLLEYIMLNDNNEYDPAVERVTLMTMHASKGLEFDIVFITGCEEGLIPYTLFGNSTIEEERRLFYVGMTRAKNKLFLTSSAKRMVYGQIIQNDESRFIDEIGSFVNTHKEPVKKKKESSQLSLFGNLQP